MLSKLLPVFRPDVYNLCLFLRADRESNKKLLATGVIPITIPVRSTEPINHHTCINDYRSSLSTAYQLTRHAVFTVIPRSKSVLLERQQLCAVQGFVDSTGDPQVDEMVLPL